ncbi:hypothetical protein [Streptomyces sp. NPDC056983]|uniref:hypothetical protein n=1 Tax=Streptomyces sp. NPDC056983 TaxID=3345987 RepID=UPI003642BF21
MGVSAIALYCTLEITTPPRGFGTKAWRRPRACGDSLEVVGTDFFYELVGSEVQQRVLEHIDRFGEYSTHELGMQPEAYEAKLDVGFTLLREQDPAAVGFTVAA